MRLLLFGGPSLRIGDRGPRTVNLDMKRGKCSTSHHSARRVPPQGAAATQQLAQQYSCCAAAATPSQLRQWLQQLHSTEHYIPEVIPGIQMVVSSFILRVASLLKVLLPHSYAAADAATSAIALLTPAPKRCNAREKPHIVCANLDNASTKEILQKTRRIRAWGGAAPMAM